MVLSFEGHKSSVWNCGCEPPSGLERHHRIAPDVKDKGRPSEFAGLSTNIERIERIPQLFGICRGSATSLQFADPPELLFGCIRHQQVRKNFAKCSSFLPQPSSIISDSVCACFCTR